MRIGLLSIVAVLIAAAWAVGGEDVRRPATVRVAAVQCYSRMGQIEYNRKLLTRLIERAAKAGAKIVVLPECAVHGYMDPGRDRTWAAKPTEAGQLPAKDVAEAVPGPSTRYFATLAKRHGIYLVVPLIETADGRFYNAQVLLGPAGKLLLHHRKHALWAPGDAAWATRGDRPVQVADTPFGRLGLMICYDVHELPKKLAEAKADIVLYSVGWYGPNTKFWYTDVFPRRYVVPNRFAVVAANWSADRGAPGWPGIGYSCITARTGKVLAMAKTTRGPEIVIADLPIRASAKPAATEPRVEVRLVPEMERIPEVDAWPRARPDAFREHTALVREAWKKTAPQVEKQLTAKVVRGLSRWAKRQMEKYDKVPPLRDAAWQPIRWNEKEGKLVLEAVLDTLPSHSPLVTRWLKGYLVYDTRRRALLRLILTIRGQALE